MEKVTQEELNEIIANHKSWLNIYGKYNMIKHLRDINYDDYLTRPTHGLAACIINKDLSDLDFRQSTLEAAVFKECNFTRANLCNVNFSAANLLGSNFCCANLKGVYLQYANLTDTNFTRAKFS